MDHTRRPLRHMLATLVYRAGTTRRRAPLELGRMGPDQAPPRREFD